MDLPEKIYEQVASLCENGDDLMDQENWHDSIKLFKEALDLLPDPKKQWEASVWINGSLGEAYFMNEQYIEAREILFDALNGPDALDNPFLHLRLGEACHELNDHEKAKEHLLRAYMLAGKELFEDEPEKYLEVISSEI